MRQWQLEWANFCTLVPIGTYVTLLGAIRFSGDQLDSPFWVLGFHHSPGTFLIAGIALLLFTFRWRLFALPVWLMVVNLVELPWLWYEPNFNTLQILFLLFAYIIARPKFKNFSWVLLTILMDVPGGFAVVNFHHIAEAATVVVFMLDIESLRWPWEKSA